MAKIDLNPPLGAAEPPSRIGLSGEGCLSRASSRAILFGTEAEEPAGPRTGEHGFGSFCRNKRISSAGTKPRIKKFFTETHLDQRKNEPGFPIKNVGNDKLIVSGHWFGEERLGGTVRDA